MSEQLQLVVERVQDHLNDILTNFKPGFKITVLVRHPEKPRADFCLTDDNLVDVAEMVTRRMEAEGIAPRDKRPQVSRNDALEEAASLVVQLSQHGTFNYKVTGQTFATHIRALKLEGAAPEHWGSRGTSGPISIDAPTADVNTRVSE